MVEYTVTNMGWGLIVNLAFALAMRSTRPRVGILDLDIFGPSIPKLMGLDRAEEPNLTPCLFIRSFLRLSYLYRLHTVSTSWRSHPAGKPRPSMHVHGLPSTPLLKFRVYRRKRKQRRRSCCLARSHGSKSRSTVTLRRRLAIRNERWGDRGTGIRRFGGRYAAWNGRCTSYAGATRERRWYVLLSLNSRSHPSKAVGSL